MDDKIKIMYIDDDNQSYLSRFLFDEYENKRGILVQDLRFKDNMTYEDLIQIILDDDINIVIIDSKLFENGGRRSKKYTGEAFSTILKTKFPFVETIVVSQNEDSYGYGFKIKFKSANSHGDVQKDATEYYSNELGPEIDYLIENVKKYKRIFEQIKNSKVIDDVLKQEIEDNIENMSTPYKTLCKDDIQNLIDSFKDIEDLL